MNDAARLLAQIVVQARLAAEALADEHEGNFRTSVECIESDAAKLADLVRGW